MTGREWATQQPGNRNVKEHEPDKLREIIEILPNWEQAITHVLNDRTVSEETRDSVLSLLLQVARLEEAYRGQ